MIETSKAKDYGQHYDEEGIDMFYRTQLINKDIEFFLCWNYFTTETKVM